MTSSLNAPKLFGDVNVETLLRTALQLQWEEAASVQLQCWATLDEPRAESSGDLRAVHSSTDGDSKIYFSYHVRGQFNNEFELSWQLISVNLQSAVASASVVCFWNWDGIKMELRKERERVDKRCVWTSLFVDLLTNVPAEPRTTSLTLFICGSRKFLWIRRNHWAKNNIWRCWFREVWWEWLFSLCRRRSLDGSASTLWNSQ